MGLKVYNTLSRTKEDFQTIEPGKVRMYVCGVTVYDKSHIGHAMSAMVFDIIRRYLEFKGYEVRHVVNFTDVDDKIITRAAKVGRDPFELANEAIQYYLDNLDKLNIQRATLNPRATQEMDAIIQMITGLIDKGYGYAVNGDVYFRVRKDEDYGKLSHRRLDDMEAGSRINIDSRKEDPMDFAMWKASKPGEPAWESPWGMGRPGWHIECSAMNLSHLGEQIDIHGGGNDLIFPHHENEISQSESYTGKPFARYWMHNGMMQMANEKMSKSLGNFITIDEFLSRHSGDSLRFWVLNSSYRNPLTYSDEIIDQSEKGVERLRDALKPALPNSNGISEEARQTLLNLTEKTRLEFENSMDDDFNSAGALGHLFTLVKSINQSRSEGATQEQLQPALDMLKKLTAVLGLQLETPETDHQTVEPLVQLLIELRAELRKQKQYALGDMIRDRLAALGIILEDGKNGTIWRQS